MATAQSSGGGTMLVKVITEGPQGPPGPVGQGFASGGTAGQVLAKASNDDYDTEWLTVGGTGTVTSVGIVPASGMVVSGSPITAAGDITLSYDSGFQAYTTAEANKLASVASGAQVNEATNLSYTASSRLLDSSTGSGITLPLFSSTEPGLVGQSGGGTVNFLRADGAWAEPPGGGGGGSGTVTSVALSVPSGFAVAGSPVTTSGTIALSFDTGYSLPTNTKQGQWDTAYSERLYWDGGATGLNAITARVSLELGNAATLNVGTTAGTVLAGDALSVHTAAADPHPNYALESSLATVATTGSYADLTNKPVIPSGADATPQPLGVAAIGASSDYAREDHIHAMPSAGDVGADPAGTSASGISAHEAAADPHPSYALESNLATVATTGAYSDLSGLPALGTAAALNTGTTSGTVATGDRGLPTGGTTGQVLQKTSGTDYDADWATLTTRTTSANGLQPALSFAAITYGATVDLDLAALDGQYRTITLTGNITFTTSNRAAGRTVVIRLLPGASERTLTFPADWVFVSTKPATLAANKTAVLSLTYFGTADTDCVAAYGVQP